MEIHFMSYFVQFLSLSLNNSDLFLNESSMKNWNLPDKVQIVYIKTIKSEVNKGERRDKS